MSKGTAIAKRRDNYRKMRKIFPERAEFYDQKIIELDAELVTLGVCRKCGRPLKSDEARDNGYGKDCLAKMMEEGE